MIDLLSPPLIQLILDMGLYLRLVWRTEYPKRSAQKYQRISTPLECAIKSIMSYTGSMGGITLSFISYPYHGLS